MRKRCVLCPVGWDRLEVRIAPSAVGHAPAAEVARIDAHIHHSHPKVHHKAHHHPQPARGHVTHPNGGLNVHASGGGTSTGGGSTGGGSMGGGFFGGGY